MKKDEEPIQYCYACGNVIPLGEERYYRDKLYHNECLERLKKEGKVETYDLLLIAILADPKSSYKDYLNKLKRAFKENRLEVYAYGRALADATKEEWDKFFNDWINDQEWHRLEVELEEPKPIITHFNLYENHVTLFDRQLDRLVDVYIKADDRYWWLICDVCQSTSCAHVDFSEGIDKLNQVMERKGLRYMRGGLKI
ncbi:MAG: hypothetical protein H3Z54_09610 [archaeon]|nr:hypothetical protein [archaeon]